MVLINTQPRCGFRRLRLRAFLLGRRVRMIPGSSERAPMSAWMLPMSSGRLSRTHARQKLKISGREMVVSSLPIPMKRLGLSPLRLVRIVRPSELNRVL